MKHIKYNVKVEFNLTEKNKISEFGIVGNVFFSQEYLEDLIKYSIEKINDKYYFHAKNIKVKSIIKEAK